MKCIQLHASETSAIDRTVREAICNSIKWNTTEDSQMWPTDKDLLLTHWQQDERGRKRERESNCHQVHGHLRQVDPIFLSSGSILPIINLKLQMNN